MNGCWSILPSILLGLVAFWQWRTHRKVRHAFNIIHRAAVVRQVGTRYSYEKRFWQDVFCQVKLALGEE